MEYQVTVVACPPGFSVVSAVVSLLFFGRAASLSMTSVGFCRKSNCGVGILLFTVTPMRTAVVHDLLGACSGGACSGSGCSGSGCSGVGCSGSAWLTVGAGTPLYSSLWSSRLGCIVPAMSRPATEDASGLAASLRLTSSPSPPRGVDGSGSGAVHLASSS